MRFGPEAENLKGHLTSRVIEPFSQLLAGYDAGSDSLLPLPHCLPPVGVLLVDHPQHLSSLEPQACLRTRAVSVLGWVVGEDGTDIQRHLQGW